MHRPPLSARRLGGTAAIACLVALVAVPASAASPAARAGSTGTSSTPSCATSGLVIWLDTRGNGTAGSVYYKLQFTNLSGHACHLRGYPGVSAIDLGGHRLGSPAARNHAHAPRTVTLARGATARAVLQIVEAGNFSAATCHQVTAAGLRVFPPGQTASKVAPFPFRACSRTGPIYLTVQTVRKT
jgi:hypothetical protein